MVYVCGTSARALSKHPFCRTIIVAADEASLTSSCSNIHVVIRRPFSSAFADMGCLWICVGILFSVTSVSIGGTNNTTSCNKYLLSLLMGGIVLVGPKRCHVCSSTCSWLRGDNVCLMSDCP